MIELLSPAGNFNKLVTAFRYGADACYFAGKKFGLRAFADNFEEDELKKAVEYAHSINKKCYVTMNIFPHNADFTGFEEYVKYLEEIKVDAVIVSDFGIISRIKELAPNLVIHISTQANITNKYTAKAYCDMGAKRLILARELSLQEIKEIRDYIPKDVEIECFVHGAMCISYSGRCLLSNYMCKRDSNRGACVQACRFKYYVTEEQRPDDQYPVLEDERGTYIFNSKDLCMIGYIDELIKAGVVSFKIEGRVKSENYVATVTNAYRRVIDYIQSDKFDKKEYEKITADMVEELEKTTCRKFTTGFFLNDTDRQNLKTSLPTQKYNFIAVVLQDKKDGLVEIEMRNRFEKGDTLQVLSPNDTFNKEFKVGNIYLSSGELVEVANLVQHHYKIETDLDLKTGDILRMYIENPNCEID